MTTTEALNKIASQEGFRDFTALMENASLSYIADRCKKAMIIYAQKAIEEDRINIVDNGVVAGYTENSIINCQKLELK